MKNINNIIWYIAGSLTTLSFIPQIYSIYFNKTNKINILFILLLFFSIILWFIYAILIKIKNNNRLKNVKISMFIWNILSIIFIILILIQLSINKKL